MGFPIRKSPDQSLFAAPRSLSQRTTSFIASQRQGIHRIPLWHLIVLINNARRSAAARQNHPRGRSRIRRHCHKKTSLLRTCPASPRSGRSAAQTRQAGHGLHADPRDGQPGSNMFLSTMTVTPRIPANQDRKLQCLRMTAQNRRMQTDRTRPAGEPDGIEPTTSCLQSTRSPNRAMATRHWWSRGRDRTERPHASQSTRSSATELWPPKPRPARRRRRRLRTWPKWWAWEDSNFRPHAYQARALTN